MVLNSFLREAGVFIMKPQRGSEEQGGDWGGRVLSSSTNTQKATWVTLRLHHQEKQCAFCLAIFEITGGGSQLPCPEGTQATLWRDPCDEVLRSMSSAIWKQICQLQSSLKMTAALPYGFNQSRALGTIVLLSISEYFMTKMFQRSNNYGEVRINRVRKVCFLQNCKKSLI